MPGGGARRHFRVQTVIGVRALLQSVLIAAELHKLPHARGRRRGHRPRHKARFGLRQVDQFDRHTLFGEDARDHVAVPARPCQPELYRLVAAIGKVIDVSQHRIINRKR